MVIKMDTSILNSIKKMLGIEPDCSDFDMDIIIHINTVFSILTQIGVGPDNGFVISDATTNWSDYIGDTQMLELVKSYMYLKVKEIFDPSSGGVGDAVTRAISELEWRISVMVDPSFNGEE